MRRSGFYWVSFISNSWVVAEWNDDSKHWSITGNEFDFYDSDFVEIDECRLSK